MGTGHRAAFTCNDVPVDVEVASGESLLSVLRERLGIVSAKDGCAPQGQCGCCTVLVDGDPRVACVTPVTRVIGRAVTTVEGLDPALRDGLVDAVCATGGSQCGFCTPGILVRAASLRERGKTARLDLDRALAAHLCRCTGWQTITEALTDVLAPSHQPEPASTTSGVDALLTPERAERAAARAELEGGVPQRVGSDVALGRGGFADDTAPRDGLVAVPLPPGSNAPSIDAAGVSWVLADSLLEARELAGKVQGRRTTLESVPPLPLPPLPAGGVRLATSWVEPAYLEPDASWCAPGGEPASPLASGGAFGGKDTSPVGPAARELAAATGRIVRTVFSREDVVRLGPKRAPIAASAVLDGATVVVRGVHGAIDDAGRVAYAATPTSPYELTIDAEWSARELAGPSVAAHERFVLADHTVLIEGALDEAGADRHALVRDGRAASVVLDTCAMASSGAVAGARVQLAATGAIERVEVRVAAGDPLDEVMLRSYAIGATHMALGWVLTEHLTVDAERGEVFDLTIRSFGVLRARDTPTIDVTIVDDPGLPRARSSDAVFAAVAAATWNAITAHDGARPEHFPASATSTAAMLGR
jgi:xanthine dehydrogenase small subunit